MEEMVIRLEELLFSSVRGIVVLSVGVSNEAIRIEGPVHDGRGRLYWVRGPVGASWQLLSANSR
ncbi:hypothetical protein ACFU8W_35545 [Streptomyces sp. NPDC057565]|uniref:hypothetical protein n=1 Tax=Streptomyces sp. NPDC057565 TaxID=3346169 RepID=UPI0036736E69